MKDTNKTIKKFISTFFGEGECALEPLRSGPTTLCSPFARLHKLVVRQQSSHTQSKSKPKSTLKTLLLSVSDSKARPFRTSPLLGRICPRKSQKIRQKPNSNADWLVASPTIVSVAFDPIELVSLCFCFLPKNLSAMVKAKLLLVALLALACLLSSATAQSRSCALP